MRFLIILPVIIAVFLGAQTFFGVDETKFVVLTRFGEIQRVIRQPGLQMKIPLVDQVHLFDNRLLRIDVRTESMPDKDQQFLAIDAYVRYQITDPERFLLRLKDQFTAQNRIGNIVISELRRIVANSDRADIIGGIAETQEDGTIIVVAKLSSTGEDTREALIRQVITGANLAVQSKENDFGVKVIDVRIKAADFPATVETTVYNRMRTERDVQAQKLRAEGEEQNLKITSDVDKEVAIIRAQAEQISNTLRGEGEGQAIALFASALEQDPEFYAFNRSLEAYEKIITETDTLVLSSQDELFKYLARPGGNILPGNDSDDGLATTTVTGGKRPSSTATTVKATKD